MNPHAIGNASNRLKRVFVVAGAITGVVVAGVWLSLPVMTPPPESSLTVEGCIARERGQAILDGFDGETGIRARLLRDAIDRSGLATVMSEYTCIVNHEADGFVVRIDPSPAVIDDECHVALGGGPWYRYELDGRFIGVMLVL